MIINKLKMSIVGILIAGMVSFSAVNSFAATASLTADVKILKPITMVIESSLNFGNVEAPLTGSVAFFRTPEEAGNGRVTIIGTPGTQVTVTHTIGTCTGTDLVLSDIIFGNPDAGPGTEVSIIEGTGSIESRHGATLTVGFEAEEGPQTCDYDIIANY